MTIQFELSDAESYKAYWTEIAAKNKLIGSANFLYGDIEIGQHEAAKWKNKKLWAWPATRARGSGQNDNYYLNREGTIWIGGPCAGKKFAQQDEFYFECEKIMKQLISKVILDFTESKLATQFNGYQLQRSDMTISATEFIGCELIFTFADPDGMEYNEDEWEV